MYSAFNMIDCCRVFHDYESTLAAPHWFTPSNTFRGSISHGLQLPSLMTGATKSNCRTQSCSCWVPEFTKHCCLLIFLDMIFSGFCISKFFARVESWVSSSSVYRLCSCGLSTRFLIFMNQIWWCDDVMTAILRKPCLFERFQSQTRFLLLTSTSGSSGPHLTSGFWNQQRANDLNKHGPWSSLISLMLHWPLQKPHWIRVAGNIIWLRLLPVRLLPLAPRRNTCVA